MGQILAFRNTNPLHKVSLEAEFALLSRRGSAAGFPARTGSHFGFCLGRERRLVLASR